MGDKPTGSLSQAYWASETGNRRAIPWDVINKFVEDEAKDVAKVNATAGEDNAGDVDKVNATAGEENTYIKAKKSNDTTSREAKSAKLAKLVEMAKSTDLWCLTPFVPSTQEAKAKQRKVCPVNLRGEVCTANNCGNKHRKSALWPTTARGRSQRERARCGTCGSRLQAKPRETLPGGGAAPTLPPAARGATAARPRSSRPSRT
jgi:hypothetical protein